MNEKRKFTSPTTIQVKNWQRTMSTEEKLDEISRLEKGEQISDICHKVRPNHSCIRTIRNNDVELSEVLSMEVSICVARLPQSYQNEPYRKL